MKLFDFDYFTLKEISQEIGADYPRLAASLGLTKLQIDHLQFAPYRGITPAHMMLEVLKTKKPKLLVSEFVEHLEACQLFHVSYLVTTKLNTS